MKIWEIFFSPLGDTARVCAACAAALAETGGGADICVYDFTLPAARQSFPPVSKEDIVVFGVPTYAGRVPNVLLKYLHTIEGRGAASIALVTFGNRAFDNALRELCELLASRGFSVAAGGAAVGPIAIGDAAIGEVPFDIHRAYPEGAVREAILQHFPGTLPLLADLFEALL